MTLLTSVLRPSLRGILIVGGMCLLALGCTVLVVPSLLGMALALVASRDVEWLELYRHLAQATPGALAWCGVICFGAGVFYPRLQSGVRKWEQLSTSRFLMLAALIALIFRVVWVFLLDTDLWADAVWYHTLAKSLAAGRGLVWEDGTPTAYVPPGYPGILAAAYAVLGPSILIGKLVNLIFGVLGLFIAYRIATVVWEERVGRNVALILALLPTQAAYTSVLFSDTVFSFCFLLLVGAGVGFLRNPGRSLYAVLMGLLAGVGALVRPVALMVPAGLLVASLLKGMSWKLWTRQMVLVTLICAVVLTPNIIRNYRQFGAFVPIATNGGINFLIGNNPEASGKYYVPDNLHLSGNEAEQSRQAYRLGFAWISEYPLNAVVVTIKKLFHLYYRDDSGILLSVARTGSPPPWAFVAICIILGNLIYYGISSVGLYRIWRRRRLLSAEEGFLLVVAFLVTGFYLVYFGADRFHLPLIPVIIGFALSGGIRPSDQPQSRPD